MTPGLARLAFRVGSLGHPQGSRGFPVVLFTSPCGPQGGAVSTPNPGLCQVGLELAAQSSELAPPVGSGAGSGA